MTHAELLAAIQREYSRGDTRLFRANVGMGWTGKIMRRTTDLLVLSHYRPFHGMPEGVLDLMGWCGPDFVAIDAKVGRDKLRPAQVKFIELVLECGGRAGEARSVEDAGRIIATAN